MAAPGSGGFDWSIWAAWAQMLVALLALAFTISESRRSRRERRIERLAADSQRREERDEADRDRRLRARPNLFGTWMLDEDEDNAEFIVKNEGLGPATIVSYEATFGGATYKALDAVNLETICRDLDIVCQSKGHYPALASGTSIAPGETARLLSMHIVKRTDKSPPLAAIPGMFDFHISYVSIYGDLIEDVTGKNS
ncbi:hypothetical protein [Lysobacter sp. Root604]|uniref:hypothetical protein n=1 Tax=Lysobacter sp. Root604 TaxID=1736568 RepID=UPI0012FC7465|nr:hypothetical protein [Lysobacter sp. Root604]